MQNNIDLIEKEQEVEIDIFEFVHYLTRRIKYIVLGFFTGAVIAALIAYLLITPVYEATAQIYVVNSKDSVVNLSDLQIGSYLTSDYQLVFDTWEVNEMVINKLGLSYTPKQLSRMLTVENPSNTRALFIKVRSKNQKEVALIANAFANVTSEYIAKTMQTEKPTILSEALEPENPEPPSKLRITFYGMVIGTFIALVALFIAYIKDDKIKTSDDIQKYTGTVPLSIIPILPFENKKEPGEKSNEI